MLNNANVSWNALRAGVSELAITLGTTFLPVAVTTLGYINRAAGAVSQWAREHPQAAALIMQLVAGLAVFKIALGGIQRSEEHTSELQSLMRISYSVFCLTTKKK